MAAFSAVRSTASPLAATSQGSFRSITSVIRRRRTTGSSSEAAHDSSDFRSGAMVPTDLACTILSAADWKAEGSRPRRTKTRPLGACP